MDEGRSRHHRRLVAVTVLSYLAGLAWLSLARGGAWNCGPDWLSEQDIGSRADVLVNVLAYVPLGALLAGPAGRRLPHLLAAILLAGLFSLSIETLQACMPERVSSWADLLANMTGAGIGALLPALASRTSLGLASGWVPGLRAGSLADEPVRTLALLTIVAWVLGRTFPWVLSLDVGQMRANLAFLRVLADEDFTIDGWRLIRHVAAWTMLGLSVRAALNVWAPVLRMTAVLVCSVLLLQLLLADPSGSIEELLGLVLAVPILVLFRFPAARRWLPYGLAASAFVVAGAYELQPGHGVSAGAFGWLPVFGSGSQVGALQLGLFYFGFAFACALAVAWHEVARARRERPARPASRRHSMSSAEVPAEAQAGGPTPRTSAALQRSELRARSSGRRHRRRRRNRTAIAFALSIAWLVLLEIAQVWIPGRIADPSPPLLAAIGWAIAFAVWSRIRGSANPRDDRSSV